MLFRNNNSAHHDISYTLARCEDLVVLVLTGHRFMEDLLEDYVAHTYESLKPGFIARHTFEQKMSLVLAHIDLPSWRDDDDSDYLIAADMLGNIELLNKIRRDLSKVLLHRINQTSYTPHNTLTNINDQLIQCLHLCPNISEIALKQHVLAHILCLHAYFAAFTESTFEEGSD